MAQSQPHKNQGASQPSQQEFVPYSSLATVQSILFCCLSQSADNKKKKTHEKNSFAFNLIAHIVNNKKTICAGSIPGTVLLEGKFSGWRFSYGEISEGKNLLLGGIFPRAIRCVTSFGMLSSKFANIRLESDACPSVTTRGREGKPSHMERQKALRYTTCRPTFWNVDVLFEHAYIFIPLT